jgi:hypothetical protein
MLILRCFTLIRNLPSGTVGTTAVSAEASCAPTTSRRPRSSRTSTRPRRKRCATIASRARVPAVCPAAQGSRLPVRMWTARSSLGLRRRPLRMCPLLRPLSRRRHPCRPRRPPTSCRPLPRSNPRDRCLRRSHRNPLKPTRCPTCRTCLYRSLLRRRSTRRSSRAPRRHRCPPVRRRPCRPARHRRFPAVPRPRFLQLRPQRPTMRPVPTAPHRRR